MAMAARSKRPPARAATPGHTGGVREPDDDRRERYRSERNEARREVSELKAELRKAKAQLKAAESRRESGSEDSGPPKAKLQEFIRALTKSGDDLRVANETLDRR